MLIYQGSTGISMPRPFRHLKAELMERIADGKILLGELIEGVHQNGFKERAIDIRE